ncbi:hypothetical protein N5D09_17365 [Stutzerimonas stutzeri]|uniref:DNA helicase n=1 Tax=Stutzerimonas stutzeri TaxID=316 RepID=A0ABD4Y498_STUST|nr:hypothetical protein [Stutzerimonas stutzeri]MDH0689864.1 hypothetical protein [Stutzerimonas stutzeri]RRV69503.1 hypothetical protein EGJ18_19770 [Stutzerimonas stutzeri]
MHPEHFDLSSPLFLPVASETCASLLGSKDANGLATLSDAELAAILVVQHLSVAEKKELTPSSIERNLSKLIAWAVGTQHSDARGLLSEAQRLFDPRRLRSGGQVAKSLNLRFLSSDEVAARDYLLPNGRWDFEFRGRHYKRINPFSEQMITPRHRERWLSPAQDKLVRTFRANLDEDLHVQGYAGIGKSHLLGTLMECLRPGGALLLAHTSGKLEALRKRIGDVHGSKAGLTFIEFAQLLLNDPKPKPVNELPKFLSKRALSQELNIIGVRDYDTQSTLNICLKVLKNYCRSRDYTLSTKHLPYFNQPLSSMDARVVLEYSSQLWGYLESNPAWYGLVELDALLMIKRASLSGCVVPARYSHVLIDESQDVPASLMQIIERGRQVLITLGDEYQQAGGAFVSRGRGVRRSEIAYSVRSGRNVESLVNPLIYRHSSKGKIPFEGASNTDIAVKYYPQGFLPPEGCVVLAASRWDMMKWIIQMDAAGRALIPSTEAQKDLKRFMATAIALFKPDFYSVEQIPDGPHLDFSEFSSWQQVCDANRYDESFLWVEAELEKGFNVADMNQLKGMLGQSGNSCMVMMAEQAGGMEFDVVLLTPQLLTVNKFRDVNEFDQRICAVYIAISRAKFKLYVPYDVAEWIAHHDSQKFREFSGY